MTSRYPAATWRPVVNHGHAGNPNALMSAHIGLVLHVQQGNGSPFGWFNNPHSQASSTWWVAKSGAVEQFVDADVVAWAQAAGNFTYNSVETEGFVSEPLTQQQVSALAALYVWGYHEFGWPLALANVVGEHGFAWHGMGGVPWGGHPGCPGVIREAQRAPILAEAHLELFPPTTIEGDDMLVYYVEAGDKTGAGFVLSGNQRWHISAAEATARRAAGEVVHGVQLPSTDPFWSLPILVP